MEGKFFSAPHVNEAMLHCQLKLCKHSFNKQAYFPDILVGIELTKYNQEFKRVPELINFELLF